MWYYNIMLSKTAIIAGLTTFFASVMNGEVPLFEVLIMYLFLIIANGLAYVNHKFINPTYSYATNKEEVNISQNMALASKTINLITLFLILIVINLGYIFKFRESETNRLFNGLSAFLATIIMLIIGVYYVFGDEILKKIIYDERVGNETVATINTLDFIEKQEKIMKGMGISIFIVALLMVSGFIVPAKILDLFRGKLTLGLFILLGISSFAGFGCFIRQQVSKGILTRETELGNNSDGNKIFDIMKMWSESLFDLLLQIFTILLFSYARKKVSINK